jgi:hypothetical protein
MLWDEYIERCPEGYRYSRFCELYRNWASRLSVTMRQAPLPNEEKNCEPGGLPGIKDQVDITFSGGQVVRAYDLGGRIGRVCYVGNKNRVRKLHEYLHELMTRYYPVPFPKT